MDLAEIWRRPAAGVLLIAVVGGGAFWNTLGGEFVWDDRSLVLENEYVKHRRNLPGFFLSDFSEHSADPHRSGYYRPLILVSYFVDASLWGDRPAGFHATNVLFHILNSILVYGFARSMASRRASLIAGVLFAAHPVHTEAVAWVAGRTDLICCFFGLIAFVCFARSSRSAGRRRTAWYLASLLGLGLGLLSKETAIVLPLLFVAYDRYRGTEGRRVRYYAGAFAVAGAYLIARVLVLGQLGPDRAYYGGSVWTSLLTSVTILASYVGLLLAPVRLSAMRSTTYPSIRSPFHPSFIVSAVVVGSLFVAASRLVKVSRGASFGILWIVVTLLPVLNLVPIYELIAERFLYIPSIGFCLALGIALDAMFRRKGALRVVALGLTGLTVAVYLVLAMDRNADWRDEITLYTRTAEDSPRAYMAHYNLGTIYLVQGEYDRAIRALQRAVSLHPSYMQACYNMACAYALKGARGPALLWLRRAIERGMRDHHRIQQDPDLESLRDHPEYLDLMRGLGRD